MIIYAFFTIGLASRQTLGKNTVDVWRESLSFVF